MAMASLEEKNPIQAERQALPDSPKSEQLDHDADIVVDPKAEQKLLFKLDFCIYPTLFVIYMMSFLDRINISNARIQGMEEDLNLYGDRFNIALFVSSVMRTHQCRPRSDHSRSTSSLTSSLRSHQTCSSARSARPSIYPALCSSGASSTCVWASYTPMVHLLR